ncbi:MAG: sugar 3,4-ketoisomerase [Prosthecobacter sp.]|uniref:sugar 3,4-ketoisomerase n=1 Tax=Prosthecobacter sp. TaxID=1965333 RepID=UPI003903AD30
MIHETTSETCSVRGVRRYEMRHVVDRVRGHLTVGDFGSDLPFIPQRYFLTYAIPSEQTRGEHAHRRCAQFLVCTHGECHLRVDDGENCEEFCLNRPTFGVLVPPLVWATAHLHSHDSVLMVLASRPYEPEDYIRDYRDFLAAVKDGKSSV